MQQSSGTCGRDSRPPLESRYAPQATATSRSLATGNSLLATRYWQLATGTSAVVDRCVALVQRCVQRRGGGTAIWLESAGFATPFSAIVPPAPRSCKSTGPPFRWKGNRDFVGSLAASRKPGRRTRSRQSGTRFLECKVRLTPIKRRAEPPGAVAQLGERCVRNAEVEGSTPFRSTRLLVSATSPGWQFRAGDGSRDCLRWPLRGAGALVRGSSSRLVDSAYRRTPPTAGSRLFGGRFGTTGVRRLECAVRWYPDCRLARYAGVSWLAADRRPVRGCRHLALRSWNHSRRRSRCNRRRCTSPHSLLPFRSNRLRYSGERSSAAGVWPGRPSCMTGASRRRNNGAAGDRTPADSLVPRNTLRGSNPCAERSPDCCRSNWERRLAHGRTGEPTSRHRTTERAQDSCSAFRIPHRTWAGSEVCSRLIDRGGGGR